MVIKPNNKCNMTVVNSEEGFSLPGFHLGGQGQNLKVKRSAAQRSFLTKVNNNKFLLYKQMKSGLAITGKITNACFITHS